MGLLAADPDKQEIKLKEITLPPERIPGARCCRPPCCRWGKIINLIERYAYRILSPASSSDWLSRWQKMGQE